MVMPVAPSPEVAREPAHRRIAHDAAEYRQWLRDGAHKSGRVDPLEATDVANECAHERLPGDPCPSPDGVWPYPHPCGCWGEPRARTPQLPTPDLMKTLKAKETPMTTETPTGEPKYGYKADGVTPRKRPAPSAQQLANAAAARAAKANGRSVAPLRTVGTSAVAGTSKAPPLAAIESPILGRMIAELDAEIALLTSAREALRGVA